MNSLNPNWLTWKKVACVALLLLAAGYIYGRPTLERWLGIELWEIPVGQENNQNDADDGEDQSTQPSFNPANIGKPENSENESNENGKTFVLKDVGQGKKQSPAGLVYGMGARGETRIDHILRHSKDAPDRPVHGVFDGDRDEILALLDNAFRLIQKNSNQVNGRKSNQGGSNRMEYVIKMNRRIGYIGGQKGKRKSHPSSSTLKMVLEGNSPITAFPM